MVYNKEFLSKAILAGFLNVFCSKMQAWQFCWCFMTTDELLCFDNLQSEEALLAIELKNIVVLSRGLTSVELYDIENKQSHFIYNHKMNDMKVWVNKLKHYSINCNPNNMQYKIFQISSETTKTQTKTQNQNQGIAATTSKTTAKKNSVSKTSKQSLTNESLTSVSQTLGKIPAKSSIDTESISKINNSNIDNSVTKSNPNDPIKKRRKSDSYTIHYFASKSKKNRIMPSQDIIEPISSQSPSNNETQPKARKASEMNGSENHGVSSFPGTGVAVGSSLLVSAVSEQKQNQTNNHTKQLFKPLESTSNIPKNSSSNKVSNDCLNSNIVDNNSKHNASNTSTISMIHENDVFVECYRCNGQVSVDSVLSPDYQLKPSCIDCLRKEILIGLNEKDYKFLTSNYSIQDLIELLTANEFNKYLDLSLNNLLETGDYFVQCPNKKCNSLWEFIHGDIAMDAPDFSRVTGISNKLLDEDAQRHYLSHRVCCRQCGTNFCRSCMTTPYHSGFNCQIYELYKNAEKCRFCGVALMPDVLSNDAPSKALENVCNNELCLTKRDQTCVKHLNCGHVCIGVRDETQCISCIEDNCNDKPKYIAQSLDDYCNICFTETLAEAPCIELDCGHVFHYQCILQRVKEKWNPPRITFNFMNCPLCKIKISHPLLDKLDCVQEMQALHRDLEVCVFL